MTHIHGTDRQKRIAVIGSGISGLSAAWLLSGRHEVTLFERQPRLGGHTNTVTVPHGDREIAVDTGFIVYNDACYPNLVALFDHLGVETAATDMSFSVSIDKGRFEYAGSDLNGLVAQRRNVLRPRFWTMLRDISRFYREAPALLNEPESSVSLGAYLAQGGYSDTFVHDHLIPMGAAIWSTPADKMLSYPAHTFVRFCQNHGLLQLNDRPQWRTVRGGAKNYVDAMAKRIWGGIRVGAEEISVRRGPLGPEVRHLGGYAEVFDDVVIATHANEALAMLEDPTPQEEMLLGAFRYQPNRAILHSDPRLMPKRKAAWASWNYLARHGNGNALSVTYWMNRLQPIGNDLPLFVTLNPADLPAEEHIHGDFDYDHPIFDEATDQAQRRLWSLQGEQHTWFCGAYFGWGFHEDGLQSGLAVAEALGDVHRPWDVENESYRIHIEPGANTPSKAA